MKHRICEQASVNEGKETSNRGLSTKRKNLAAERHFGLGMLARGVAELASDVNPLAERRKE